MNRITRRTLLAGGLAAAIGGAWLLRSRKVPVGVELAAGTLERARKLLESIPVVDVHSHAGRSFLVGSRPASMLIRLMRDGYEERRLAGMRRSGVNASLFSIVADLPLLGLADGGLKVTREFEPGEAWDDFNRQLDRLLRVAAKDDVRLALSAADIRAAASAGQAAMVLASEGGDFIEDDVDRIATAQRAGLRCITLVHYNLNQLADNQTDTPRYGGLSSLGREVVNEMNRQGLIVDLAHASIDACRDAASETRAPLLLSHSNLNTSAVSSPRFISHEHARIVADTGGVIGGWPAGIGSVTLADFARQLLTLIAAVGTEHVAIGSDLDANYKPVLTDYEDFPVLAAILLDLGLSEDAIRKVFGANFLRLLDDVSATARV